MYNYNNKNGYFHYIYTLMRYKRPYLQQWSLYKKESNALNWKKLTYIINNTPKIIIYNLAPTFSQISIEPEPLIKTTK